MKKNFIIALIFGISVLFGTSLVELREVVDLGQVNVDSNSSFVFHTANSTDEPITYSVIEDSPVYTFSQEEFTVPAQGEVNIDFTVNPETNICYDYTVFFVDSEHNNTLPVNFKVQGHLASSTYDNTYNKYDNDLKTALKSIINNHHSIGYSQARVQLFGYIANENGRVRCVYTNQWYNCSPGSTPNWNDINTEHTWPQSHGATGDAKSDLHHLFPTNSQANSIRSNHPFGEVTDASWNNGGSKKGHNAQGQTVFEPRDDHKGDVARAMFYFSLRYNNPDNFLNSANQQPVLRNWYFNDPVSEYEIHRNNEIVDIQNKPNPFIEHQEFLTRIASITSNSATTPKNPVIVLPYDSYDFSGCNQTTTAFIPIANNGLSTLNISTVTTTNEAFSVVSFPNSINVGEWANIEITFTPIEGETSNGNLIINGSNEQSLIALSGSLSETPNDSNDSEPLSHLTLTNYPNPFSNSTKFVTKGIKENNSEINIYNIRGQKVNTMNINNTNGGNASVTWNGNDKNGSSLPSGVYFAKIKSGKEKSIKKILLINK